MSLPKPWLDWVSSNLNRGVPGQALLDIMLEHGFGLEPCRDALKGHLPEPVESAQSRDFYLNVADAPLRASKDYLQPLVTQGAQLFKIQHFLSAGECQQLIDLTERHLRPSELASCNDDHLFRTSSTSDLDAYDDPLVGQLNERIARTLGLAPEWGEPVQGQRYLQGQEFKAHTDYFEPGTDEYQNHARDRGQRCWTLMIYLNQDFAGGQTEFPRLGLSVLPEQGMALLWNNLTPAGSVNPNTLHHAHPVEDGRKYVITKWFRDRAH